MLSMTLKHHSWEPEVEVILIFLVWLYRLLYYMHTCGHRGNFLRSECRYDTIRYDWPVPRPTSVPSGISIRPALPTPTNAVGSTQPTRTNLQVQPIYNRSTLTNITVMYKKHRLSALIDTGSDITIVGANFAKKLSVEESSIIPVNSRKSRLQITEILSSQAELENA